MSYQNYVPLSDYELSYTVPIPLPWNPTIYCIIAAFSALPMWMTIELTFQIFSTFKRYNGLYFYSLLFCTWSITIRQIGRVCIYFVPGCNQIFSLVFAMLGWVGTVTGFAVVLYSRLHLVTRSRRILNSVLCMITVSVFAFHLPSMIAQIGVVTKHQPQWISWYPAMEKVQIVGFTVQESIISTIYVISTHKLISGSYNKKTRKNIKLLIIVQVLCVSLDLPVVVLTYLDLFLIKVTLASFGYAVKLKLEFIVLNNLLDIAKNGVALRGIQHTNPNEEAGEKAESRNNRRHSMTPSWRRVSRSPKHSTPHKRLSHASQVCVADMMDKKPTPALPRLPVTEGQPPNISHPSTFNSLLSTSSANTDVISLPHFSRQRTDENLIDVGKQYLGQYGIRTVRAL